MARGCVRGCEGVFLTLKSVLERLLEKVMPWAFGLSCRGMTISLNNCNKSR